MRRNAIRPYLGLRGFQGVDDLNLDWQIVPNGQFRLKFQVESGNSNWQQLLFLRLNDVDGLNGPTDLSVVGPIATITGRAASGTARQLKSKLLDVVDDHVRFTGSTVFLEADVVAPSVQPVQQNTGRNVSTREPIVDREPEQPRTILDDPVPTPEPTGSTGNGSGSGSGVNPGAGSGSGQQGDSPLPVNLSGEIFGIPVKFLLIGAVAFFFLSKK